MSNKKTKCKKCGEEIPFDSVVKHFSECKAKGQSQIQQPSTPTLIQSNQVPIQAKCGFCDQMVPDLENHTKTCVIKNKIDYLLKMKSEVKLNQAEYKRSIKKAEEISKWLTELLTKQIILTDLFQEPIPKDYCCSECQEIIKTQNVLKEVLQVKQCKHYFHKKCLLESIVVQAENQPLKFVCPACDQ